MTMRGDICPECIREVAGLMSLCIFLLSPSGALGWELGVTSQRAPSPHSLPTRQPHVIISQVLALA